MKLSWQGIIITSLDAFFVLNGYSDEWGHGGYDCFLNWVLKEQQLSLPISR